MTTRIITANVIDGLRQLTDESVHCCVTSPPYYGLRLYWSEPQVWGAWCGDLGLEPTPELYVTHLVEVFREVRRVLRKDGTLWLNIGDSYTSRPDGSHGGWDGDNKKADGSPRVNRYASSFRVGNINKNGGNSNRDRVRASAGGKPKDLLMIPAQLALALRTDGWWLRSEIVWAKKNPMPESVTDRPTYAHEKVFLLTKAARYFYDAETVKEEAAEGSHVSPNRNHEGKDYHNGRTERNHGYRLSERNMRNVWHLGPEPYHDAHFATFPSEVPRRAILAGTSAKGVCPKCGAQWVRVVSPQTIDWLAPCNCADAETAYWAARGVTHTPGTSPGTILDPFLGAGTTTLVADQLGRDCIGIELNANYASMAEKRLRDDAGMFAFVTAE